MTIYREHLQTALACILVPPFLHHVHDRGEELVSSVNAGLMLASEDLNTLVLELVGKFLKLPARGDNCLVMYLV